MTMTETREQIIERATREAEAKYPFTGTLSTNVYREGMREAYIAGVTAEAERRAKDRELLQMAADALARLDFLHECELEAMSSGQPSATDWRMAFNGGHDTLSALKDAGITPTEA